MDDTEYSDVADAVNRSELSHCVTTAGVKVSNPLYQLRSQFRAWVILSARISSLIHCVMVIIANCSKPQMVRVYARWIVSARTVVTNTEPFWDFPFEQLPRIAMRRDDSPVYRQSAVSKLHFASLPQPASRCFFDMVKKTNSWIKEAGSRAVMVFHCFNENLCSVMGFSADVASNCHSGAIQKTDSRCNN